MNDSQKLLQTIINHQSSVKEELLKEIRKLSTELDKFKTDTKENFDKVNGRMDELENKLTNRINLLGKQLAVLDEDAPTREEFDELVEKVNRIPKNFVMA